MFGVNDLDGDEVIVDNVDVVKTTEEIVNAAATTVSTASTISVSAATTITTTTVSDVEITLAQALTKLKSAKPKVDKVVIEELEQGTTITTLTTTAATTITAASTRPKVKGVVIHEHEAKHLQLTFFIHNIHNKVKVQDKGKDKMVEPEPVNKMSKKDLLRLDEELALSFKLRREEERTSREKAQQTEEYNRSYR
ncbi:hypothetical protein Tco_1083630 [Tanacetum coccineum]